MASLRPTLYIVNPAAGAGAALSRWQRLHAHLREQNLEGEVAITTAPGDALRIARERALDYPAIVAVGGDGTVLEIANGLIGSKGGRAALGIIPFGTGNDIATMAGVSSEAKAVRALAKGDVRLIDTVGIDCLREGIPSHSHSILFAGVGIIGSLLRLTTTATKRIFGRGLAYRVGLIRALARYRATPLRLECDGQVFKDNYLFVGASNSEEAGGGMRLAPGARPDDGVLNLNLVQSLGRWEALRQLRRLSKGTHITHPQVRYFTGRTVRVEADQEVDVAADGEVIGTTPARFEVRPESLRLVIGFWPTNDQSVRFPAS